MQWVQEVAHICPGRVGKLRPANGIIPISESLLDRCNEGSRNNEGLHSVVVAAGACRGDKYQNPPGIVETNCGLVVG